MGFSYQNKHSGVHCAFDNVPNELNKLMTTSL